MADTDVNAQHIKLQPPGAGLPLLDYLVARYFIFPYKICGLSKEEAIKKTLDMGHDCIKITQAIGLENAEQPVLVRPLKGVEDSSRNWSAAMTLEHLIIVQAGVQKVIENLCNHKPLERVVGTADVKPTGTMSAQECIDQFGAMMEAYPKFLEPFEDMDNKNYKHQHPWFGKITAYQWMCTNAQHTKIHRYQLKEIHKAFG